MRPIYHIIASSVLAVLIYIFTRQVGVALLAFIVGVFVDLDHLIDFWALKPANPFDVREFLDSEHYNQQSKHIFIFLHGWEWAGVLFALAYFYNWNIYLLVSAIALVLHLIIDTKNLSNGQKHSPFIYLFFFRLLKGFKKQNLIMWSPQR